MWAYLARKGLHTLTPTFPEFIFNVGFTIEARKDEEMPGEFARLRHMHGSFPLSHNSIYCVNHQRFFLVGADF